MTECPYCGTSLERPKPGWIEIYRRKKDSNEHVICVGKLFGNNKIEWLEGESRLFNWLDDEARLAELEGEYCPRGHLDMKTVEEPIWKEKQKSKNPGNA